MFKSIRKHLPIKKVDPNKTNSNYRIITFEQPSSVISECYRRVKVSLSFANVDKKLQVIGVTSAVQGEGKTLSILNIASTYVEDGSKVCVIDLDLRRPKAHRTIKVRNENGVADVCSGAIKLEDAIKHSEYGFDILNAGSKVSYPTALLGSQTLEGIIGELKAKYDVVLVDCPPIVPVTDAVIISRLCDGMIFVVSQKIKEKQAAKEGVNILKKNNVTLLGVLFTEVDLGSKSYYSSKYRYYHKYAYDQAKKDVEEEKTNDVAMVEEPVAPVEPAPVEEPKVEEPAPAVEEAPKAEEPAKKKAAPRKKKAE